MNTTDTFLYYLFTAAVWGLGLFLVSLVIGIVAPRNSKLATAAEVVAGLSITTAVGSLLAALTLRLSDIIF